MTTRWECLARFTPGPNLYHSSWGNDTLHKIKAASARFSRTEGMNQQRKVCQYSKCIQDLCQNTYLLSQGADFIWFSLRSHGSASQMKASWCGLLVMGRLLWWYRLKPDDSNTIICVIYSLNLILSAYHGQHWWLDIRGGIFSSWN